MMQKRYIFLLFVSAFLLGCGGTGVDPSGGTDPEPGPEPLATKEIYVSLSGNDAASGTREAPLRSIAKAVERAVPGSTVYLRGGIWRTAVRISKSGKADAPITLAAYPGETPVLDGGNGTGWTQAWNDYALVFKFAETDARLPAVNSAGGLIILEGASHWVFQGLTLRGSASNGFYATKGSSHVLINQCVVENCIGPAISFGADNSASTGVTLTHNHVKNCAQRSREAISLRTVRGFEVAGNTVEKVIKESIDAKSGCRNGTIHHNYVLNSGHCGIYLDAGFPDRPEEENIEIYDNIVENPYGTAICVAAEAGNSISEVRIYNNLVWSVRPENRGCGIKVAKNSDNTDGLIKDIYIYHNTVYGFKQQGIYVNYPQVENIRICNNISANTLNQLAIRDQDVKDPKQIVMDRNLAHGPVSHPGRGLITGDPLFTDPEGGDFTLREGSPAIDTGYKKFSTSHDLTGEVRPQGRAADLGAYEYKRKKK